MIALSGQSTPHDDHIVAGTAVERAGLARRSAPNC